MKVYESEAKTKELALDKCLEEARANKDEVLFKSKETVSGILKKSKYKVTLITKAEVKEEIMSFFTELGNRMNIKITPEVNIEEHIFVVTLDSSNNAVMIGKDGRSMKSLQILVKQSIVSKTGINVKINLDVSGYKEKKLKHLENTVKRVASEVIQSKIDTKLDSMNSYERRFVHSIINEYTMLETKSEGEEPNRYIVISYKQD
jgi:Predicted RNA-binding protein